MSSTSFESLIITTASSSRVAFDYKFMLDLEARFYVELRPLLVLLLNASLKFFNAL